MEARGIILCSVLEGLLLRYQDGEFGGDIGFETAEGEGVAVELQAGLEEGGESTGAPGESLMSAIYPWAHTYSLVGVQEVRVLDVVIDCEVFG